MVRSNRGQQHGITAVITKSTEESVMKVSGSLAERFTDTKFRDCCSASSYSVCACIDGKLPYILVFHEHPLFQQAISVEALDLYTYNIII